MKRADVVLAIAALLIGILAAYSSGLWMTGVERGRTELRLAKEDLIGSAGLFELHNRIYSDVGLHAWETRVKPEFMSMVTRATVRDTGILLPAPSDVVGWVRRHPDLARGMLEGAAASR